MRRGYRMPSKRHRPWEEEAACAHTDPEVFFRDDTERQAKKVCEGCPVNAKCLRENIDTPFGIFGGLTSQERGFIRGKATRG